MDYKVTANMSKDGFIYGDVITFSQENDKELLGSISGIDGNLTVQLPAWALERSADDEYELIAISDNTEYKFNFLRDIENLDRLREIEIDDASLRQILLRQLFISIIGAVETYLSDAFINKALSSTYYLENFVNTHPDFKKQKISVSEVFNTSISIKEKAKTLMVTTIYHKPPVVREMYQQTFHIDFPDISTMQKYVTQRHDLVHRNGKTTDGKVVNIGDESILALKSAAIELVNAVSREFEYDDIPSNCGTRWVKSCNHTFFVKPLYCVGNVKEQKVCQPDS